MACGRGSSRRSRARLLMSAMHDDRGPSVTALDLGGLPAGHVADERPELCKEGKSRGASSCSLAPSGVWMTTCSPSLLRAPRCPSSQWSSTRRSTRRALRESVTCPGGARFEHRMHRDEPFAHPEPGCGLGPRQFAEDLECDRRGRAARAPRCILRVPVVRLNADRPKPEWTTESLPGAATRRAYGWRVVPPLVHDEQSVRGSATRHATVDGRRKEASRRRRGPRAREPRQDHVGVRCDRCHDDDRVDRGELADIEHDRGFAPPRWAGSAGLGSGDDWTSHPSVRRSRRTRPAPFPASDLTHYHGRRIIECRRPPEVGKITTPWAL